jgi:hypothetical protein
MKSIDNKKARTLDGKGLIDVNNFRKVNMTNITHFAQGKQVQVSEHQLSRLLDLIKLANKAFSELNALSYAARDQLDKNSIAHTLMGLALEKSSQLKDECMEELEFFKECSPQLVEVFAKELVA